MSGHTPGPWTTSDVGRAFGRSIYAMRNGQEVRIAEVYGLHNLDADARLIAKAPEMLDALLQIRTARDLHADTGSYGSMRIDDTEYDCFDDWAADVAHNILRYLGHA